MKSKGSATILFVIGLILLYFSNGRMGNEIIGFIAPLFLILAGRHMRIKRLYLQYSLSMGFIFLLAFWKFSSTNIKDPLFYIPFFLGFLMSVPYVADAFFHQRQEGMIADLGFPLTYVLVEFMYVTLSPLGSTGSIAYAQDGFTVLLQLLSITGIYGITFIVSWFGASMATVIEDRFMTKASVNAIISYVTVFSLVMLFGLVRLGINEKQECIKVSGISVYELRSKETKALWRQATKQTEAFNAFKEQIYKKLVSATREEAAKGVKVIVWSELSPWMSDSQTEEYEKRIADLAKQCEVYIVASPYVFPKHTGELGLNEAIIFSPEGELAIRHIKYGGAMLDGIVEGDKKLQVLRTPYGKMGTAICWDADFPAIMRQCSKLGIDMLFSPAADWMEITPLHSLNLYYRGIENGMNVLRQTASGQSLISDAKGRIIAKQNSFDTPEADKWIIHGEMPTRGCATIYGQIGDVFAYICIIGLVVLMYFRRIPKKAL